MFQTRLKELREAAGYKSQQSLADALGISQSTVGNWESGRRSPKRTTAIQLAKFFGVSVDYLLGLTDQPDLKQSIHPAFTSYLTQSVREQLAVEVQGEEKPTPGDGDGLDSKKVLLIQKIIELDKDSLERLIQVADSVLGKRDE